MSAMNPDPVVRRKVATLERCLDRVAMRVVASLRLGLPQDSREAFTLLERAGLLPGPVAHRMRRMVGFRKIAVPAYQDLDRAIVADIALNRRGDFEAFSQAVMVLEPPPAR